MNNDLCLINENVSKLIGLKAYSAQLGHGSFLTIDFGVEREIKTKFKNEERIIKRGEWYLWVQMCSWRIEKDGNFIAGSHDPREKLQILVKEIENKRLIEFKILNQFLDSEWRFEDDIVLSFFSCDTEENCRHWTLFTPDDNVLAIGPGSKWVYKSASIAR